MLLNRPHLYRFFTTATTETTNSVPKPRSWRMYGFAAILAAVTAGGVYSYYTYEDSEQRIKKQRELWSRLLAQPSLDASGETDGLRNWRAPTRESVLKELKSSRADQPFDLLVIGGGATGTGVALDAASRGLRVALVERDDFASGTSSRSTKLVHGGVRYLEKAFCDLDKEQYNLVVEALHERKTFLDIAPYLSSELPIMLPVYKWYMLPYYYMGAKAYDLLAGRQGLSYSYFLSAGKAKAAFPALNKDGLIGAIVYYDGQQNDARMNVALALTAAATGAVVANHCRVDQLLQEPRQIQVPVKKEPVKEEPNKDKQDKQVKEEPAFETKTVQYVNGAQVTDTLTGEKFTIYAKGVVNATGPFVDAIRQMDSQKSADIVAPSAGVHISLPSYLCPTNLGLFDPATSDGRVIFMLPWQGRTIAGTTDTPTKVTENPIATGEEIDFILREVQHYLSPDVRLTRRDVLAAWSGIRPLVRDPSKKSSQALVRNHLVHVTETGLLTVAGGKWTTYRHMASEAVDKAIQTFQLTPKRACTTETLQLIGSQGYTSTLPIHLIQKFGLADDVAKHLAHSYGDRAPLVAALSQPSAGSKASVFGQRLADGHSYIDGEVRYAVRHEMAQTVVDVLARRTRLAFIDVQATADAVPRVIEIMSQELGWSSSRRNAERDAAMAFLQTMGLGLVQEANANKK